MYKLEPVGPNFLRAVASYEGLLSILVYNPAGDVFESKIRKNYHALHMQSDCNLLVVAGRSDWVGESAATRMRNDVRRNLRDEKPFMGWIVALESGDEFDHARNLIDLRTRFGISINEMPCMIFITDIEGKDGYVFPFNRNLIDEGTDKLTDEMMNVFHICGSAVAREPFSDDTMTLVEWRERLMLYVEPELRKLRLFREARKIAGTLLMEGAKTLVGRPFA